MRFSPIVMASLIAAAAIFNCTVSGSNSTLAAAVVPLAAGSPTPNSRDNNTVVTQTLSTPVDVAPANVQNADFSMDEKSGGGGPQGSVTNGSGVPAVQEAMAPAALPPAPLAGHSSVENTFSGVVPTPPSPVPVVENVIAPAEDYYSDDVPAGFVRTVKTVKTEQRNGHTVITTYTVRYHRRPRSLPLSFIEIPALAMRHQIVEGVSQYAMQYGPGHFPGMAMPGEMGNCGLAAHSNVPGCDYFHYLHRLHPGNHIYIETSNGVYDYTVMDMHVVRPSYTQDLAPTPYRRLTLVTCTLPSATRRLIVVAVGAGTPIAQGTQQVGNPPGRMPLTGQRRR